MGYVMFWLYLVIANELIWLACAGYEDKQLPIFLALFMAQGFGAAMMLLFQRVGALMQVRNARGEE
jgi:Na+/H+-translocating membrane pyrophosphatase